MAEKALLTGATGFIGSHLAEYLQSLGWDILCLVRDSSQTDLLESREIRVLRGNIDDPSLLEKAVRNRDYVFHLAARIRSAPKEVYDKANYGYTRQLGQACLRTTPNLKRFVYISSISAAGASPKGTFADESLPEAPNSEYGRTKLKGEEALRSMKNLSLTVIRPPNVYGSRQQETEILIRLLRIGIVPVLKERPPATSLIYVKDLVRGISEAALSDSTRGKTYYLTDGKAYSWRDIIMVLKQAVRGKSLYLPLPEALIAGTAGAADLLKRTGLIRPFFGRSAWKAIVETPWLFSTEKAERDFGFRARYSLAEGIRETVSGSRKRPV